MQKLKKKLMTDAALWEKKAKEEEKLLFLTLQNKSQIERQE